MPYKQEIQLDAMAWLIWCWNQFNAKPSNIMVGFMAPRRPSPGGWQPDHIQEQIVSWGLGAAMLGLVVFTKRRKDSHTWWCLGCSCMFGQLAHRRGRQRGAGGSVSCMICGGMHLQGLLLGTRRHRQGRSRGAAVRNPSYGTTMTD